MKNPETALDIEYGINIKKDNNIYCNYNKEQLYKLNFNFDILNEPLPDFSKSKTNGNLFLNRNNFSYKRKYNEISNNINTYHGKVIPKFS